MLNPAMIKLSASRDGGTQREGSELEQQGKNTEAETMSLGSKYPERIIEYSVAKVQSRRRKQTF